jgi:hypothetical protein
MAIPTLEEAKNYFKRDKIISLISDEDIQYWIDDIASKKVVDEYYFGNFYFNGFMNLLGHYLLVYGNFVSYNGAVASESTAQVSRSFQSYSGDNPSEYDYSMTKYGRMFSSILSKLAICKGGFVAGGGYY